MTTDNTIAPGPIDPKASGLHPVTGDHALPGEAKADHARPAQAPAGHAGAEIPRAAQGKTNEIDGEPLMSEHTTDEPLNSGHITSGHITAEPAASGDAVPENAHVGSTDPDLAHPDQAATDLVQAIEFQPAQADAEAGVSVDAARVPAPTGTPLDAAALDQLFRTARTPDSWAKTPVTTETLHQLYDLMKFGPTSGNCSPLRLVFLTTPQARERLRPALSLGNVEKVLAAPVIAIVAHDPLFFDRFALLNPEPDLRSWFAGDIGLSEETAFRNGTLQGAYLILAARALGLDVLPISGFDGVLVEDSFLASQGWRANFLLCLGHAAYPPEKPRAARIDFVDACEIM